MKRLFLIARKFRRNALHLFAGGVLALSTVAPADAQITQFRLASANGRNEVGNLTKVLSDGSTIVAGYNYDLDSTKLVRQDILLLKVSANGTIAWQKQFGTPGNSSLGDLPLEMVIAANGDILLCGTMSRTDAAHGNNAFVARIDAGTGNVIWWRRVRENNGSNVFGETYYGLTEMADGRIVCVGALNGESGYAKALVSVYSSAGVLFYHDVTATNFGGSDNLNSVTAYGNSVYIGGWAFSQQTTFNSYKDMRLMRYTPGSSSGTYNWHKAWDVDNQKVSNVDIKCHGFGRIFIRNNQLVVEAGGNDKFAPDMASGFAVFKCDLNGNGARMSSTSHTYSFMNAYRMFPVSEDRIFTVENPSNQSVDPIILSSATSFKDAFITEVAGLNTTPVVNQTKSFAQAGDQTIFDLTMDAGFSKFYMAGCINDQPTPNNDIYVIQSDAAFKSPAATCDLKNQYTDVGFPELTPENYTLTGFSPSISTQSVTPQVTDPQLTIAILCGDKPGGPGTGGGGCDETCYWKLDGNNAVTGSHVLGTQNYEDIRMVTNGQQRAVLERDFGRFGINTPAPTARLHVNCDPKEGSDVRFENLGFGRGMVLVVDDQGYVWRSESLSARGTGSDADLQQEVSALRAELAALKSCLGLNCGGADDIRMSLTPNPAQSAATVQITAGSLEGCTLVVTDMAGRVIESMAAQATIQLNTASWGRGNYLVAVRKGEKAVASQKLVLN